MLQVNRHIENARAYRAATEPATFPLDANEFPLDPWNLFHESLLTTVQSVNLQRYGDAGCEEVREELARYLKSLPDRIVIGAGSDEVIGLLCLAIDKSVPVIVPSPSFSMYRAVAEIHGHPVKEVPLTEHFALDLEAFAATLGQGPGIVFLASPNNPTGNSFDLDAIEHLITTHPKVLFVLDEAYTEYANQSLRRVGLERPNVAFLGTMSKIGFASLRLGWIDAPTWLSEVLERVRMPYNVTSLSQALVVTALREQLGEIRRLCAAIIGERNRIVDQLQDVQWLTLHPSDANFFLVTVRGPDVDPNRLRQHLLAHGVRVRSFVNHPRLFSSLRITVGVQAANNALLEGLRSFS